MKKDTKKNYRTLTKCDSGKLYKVIEYDSGSRVEIPVVATELEEGIRDFVVDTKKRTVNEPTISKIDIGRVFFNEDLLWMYIESVPDELQKKIDKQIQEQALKQFYIEEDRYRSHGITPENLKMKEVWKTLDFKLNEGKIRTNIHSSAVDTIAENLEVDIVIPCNLTDDMRKEIKRVVIRVIEKKYFE